MSKEIDETKQSGIQALIEQYADLTESAELQAELLDVAAGLIERVAFDTARQSYLNETVGLLALAAELQRIAQMRRDKKS